MDHKKPELHPSWLAELEAEFSKDYMLKLKSFLQAEKSQAQIYPPGPLIFNAFNTTPLPDVRVVILGQDPYHGPDQAHGLCFSVQTGVPKPPSLENIFKELHRDLKLPIPKHGNLESWAKQGVFLLNTVLTVRQKNPQSHANQGWETFTDAVIRCLNDKRENLIFVLWGSPARRKKSMINEGKHLVLEAPHPSPLSAYRGFIGCGHFSKINQYLVSNGQIPIDWAI